MAPRRHPDDPARSLRPRHTDEWTGLLVILALALFFGAMFEADVLRRWLRPDPELRIVLPQTGFGGLVVGADVDVLGTHAGSVKQIVVNPNDEMYALATINRQTEGFIRRDSKATIRLRYSVAGAAYVDISRGAGAPMDWHYAVLAATVEPNPADALTATLNKVTADLLPILEHALHAVAALDEAVSAIKAGQGSAGRLLADDSLVRRAEDMLATLQAEIVQLGPILAPVPGLLTQSQGLLANVQSITRDAARAAPQLPALARNAAEGTGNLPVLLTQTQATLVELEKLLTQLRGLWLLGGSGASKPSSTRLSPRDVRP
ncbi:MAG: MCE family protein [Acetobacteraceae bacterium]|nr:MCE family protein [Acetobacteraceae bacterium]